MKRMASHIILVLFATCVLIFLSEQAGFSATEFADGRIHITGWLENLSSTRLGDGPDDGVHEVNKSGRIQIFRNTLQVETTVSMTPDTTLFLNTRGFYEGSWGLGQGGFENSIKDSDQVPRGKSVDQDLDLREYHLTARLGDFRLRVGRQQVVWGESDALRMSDIINPLDLSWHWVFESWEDIRIPLRMINLTYEPPSTNQFKAQLVYIPEDFRPMAFAPPGAAWAIPGVPAVVWKQQRDEMPGKHELSNGQVGGRVSGTIGNWDLSLFHFYHRVDGAVYKLDFTHAPLPMDFKWPYVNTVGATFNKFEPFTKTVFRGESAFTIDQPYTSEVLDKIIEKNTFAFMLGFDRPTMITTLNPTRSFFISGQFFYKKILDYEGNIVSTDMDRRKDAYVTSILINTNYWHDKIVPQILYVHDFSGGGGNGFGQASIQYVHSETWDVTLGTTYIFGRRDDEGFFGPVRRNDEVFLRARVKF